VAFLKTPWAWLLAGVALTLCMAWLGDGTLDNGDGAVYASAVRGMLRQGTWLRYAWHGAELQRYYPPLHFWLMRLSAGALGTTLFALRLPSALAAVACCLLVGAITARLARSPIAGLFAGLCLLAGGLFYEASRKTMLDLSFVAFGLAAAWAWLRANQERRFLPLVGVAAGAAYLCKSLFVVLLLAPMVVDLLLHRRALLRSGWLWLGLGLMAALALVWHLPLSLAQGALFLPAYGGRATAGMGSQYGLLRALGRWAALDTLVVALHLAGLVWLCLRARRQAPARFLVAWLVLGLAAFLVSATVIQHYFLVLLPPLAIGAGWLLARGLRARPIWSPVALCALLAAFAYNNVSLLVQADFSVGADRIAARARELAQGRPVLFFRDFNASFDYYLDGDNVLVTDSEASFRRYQAHGAMRQGAQVRLLAPADMLALLARPEAVCVTTLVSEPRLRQYHARLPPELAGRLVHEKAGAYTLHFFGPALPAAQP